MTTESEAPELYRKYRPSSLAKVIGQDSAVKTLRRLIEKKCLPKVILLVGPSGVGKTTIARILKDEIGCSDHDYCEVNAASDRGIDTVRAIENTMSLSPMMGKYRVWTLDEVHQLSRKKGGDAQTALLKVLEDVPKHVHFILCTTNPTELLPTILTRCTEIKLKSLSPDDMVEVINNVLWKEKKTLSATVLDRIIQVSEGSARKALGLVGKVLHLDSDDERMDVIEKKEVKQNAFELVKLLLWKNRSSWKEVVQLIDELDEGTDWESFRRLVMRCATNELKKGGKSANRAFAVGDTFEKPWYDCAKDRLVLCCWLILGEK